MAGIMVPVGMIAPTGGVLRLSLRSRPASRDESAHAMHTANTINTVNSWTPTIHGSLPPAASAAIAAHPGVHPRPRLFQRAVGATDVIAPYDHVSNVTLGRWLDELAAITFERERTVAEGLAWFIARQEIDFLAETMRHDELVAATWVVEIDRFRATRETLLARARDGAVLVRSKATWILVDLATRRPRRVPAELVATLQPTRIVDRR